MVIRCPFRVDFDLEGKGLAERMVKYVLIEFV